MDNKSAASSQQPVASNPTIVAQGRETAVQVVRGRAFSYRYAYARSADSRAAGDPGQDYLTFQEEGNSFAFALCDGVSQSFYGEIAARVLGDGLVAWLMRDLPPALDGENMLASLTARLQLLTEAGTGAVQSHALPANIPAMLRDVLEEKRAGGSDSMFVCGRLDLPGETFPKGRVVLAWMGDSRLRVWGPTGERTRELRETFKMEQRWSTHKGLVGGDPNVVVAPLYHSGLFTLRRVLAYSDGLSVLDSQDSAPSHFALQDLISGERESPTSDDISFLEVWLGPVPAEAEAKPLPAPAGLTATQDGNTLYTRWKPMRGARRYEIEARHTATPDRSQKWPANIAEWTAPPLSTGTYLLRVRALGESGPGEWSAPVEVQVKGTDPPPPPPAPGRVTPDPAETVVLEQVAPPHASTPTRPPPIGQANSSVSSATPYAGYGQSTPPPTPSPVQAPAHSQPVYAPHSEYAPYYSGQTQPQPVPSAGGLPRLSVMVGKRAPQSLLWVAVGAALAITLLFVCMFAFFLSQGEANKRAQATATAQTAIAIAASTETAVTHETATAVAQAIATAKMQATETASAVAFQETATAQALSTETAIAIVAAEETKTAIAVSNETVTAIAIEVRDTAIAEAADRIAANATETAFAENQENLPNVKATGTAQANALATRQARTAIAQERSRIATRTARAAIPLPTAAIPPTKPPSPTVSPTRASPSHTPLPSPTLVQPTSTPAPPTSTPEPPPPPTPEPSPTNTHTP